MNHNEHLEMARRILKGLAKLDPDADRFAVIDGTMVAAYHLGNAALHVHGVTRSSVHFNTPSKFEVAPDSLPSALKQTYVTFKALEELRSRYVRSADEPDTRAALYAQGLLAHMAQLCGVADG